MGAHRRRREGDRRRESTRAAAAQIYNIVDDRPQSFGDYVRELSAKLHRPRPLPISPWLLGLVAPYAATAFGKTWLPLSNAKAKAELGWTVLSLFRR